MKKPLRYIFVFCIIIIILLVIYIICKNNILKFFYKDNYRGYVEEYAEKYEVDKYLIFAIIKAESNFEEKAISNADAKGLMQIMDSTAAEIAEMVEIKLEDENSLLDPRINIELGTKYISILNEKYNNINLALAAYNAGSGNVDKWIEQEILKADGSDIENIPFKETNNYVRKILRDYNIYKEIYIE